MSGKELLNILLEMDRNGYLDTNVNGSEPTIYVVTPGEITYMVNDIDFDRDNDLIIKLV